MRLTPLLLCLAVMAAMPDTASAERRLVSHQDLVAVVADDFRCSDRVEVTVYATRPDAFGGDRRGLQRLVGGIRAALMFECPNVYDMVLIGSVRGGGVVWRGMASQSNDWVVVDLPGHDRDDTASGQQVASGGPGQGSLGPVPENAQLPPNLAYGDPADPAPVGSIPGEPSGLSVMP